MLTENQKKWVEALRSGEYTQGTKVLEGINGNLCCLGVACKVYEKETGEILDNGTLEGGTLLGHPRVRLWLNMTSGIACFNNGNLISLNDNGKTFDEIADIIESEPEGLFAK